VLTLLTAVLAAGVSLGYFAVAALILPRIQLDEQSPRFVRAFRLGGIAFFVGCGLTHAHIAVHALVDDQSASLHEVVFHLLQVFGVWVFVVVALRIVDVRVIRRRSAQELEAERLEREVTELSRSNTDLERFAHVISHDLQEPLRSVAGFADLLARRHEAKLDEPGREALHFIRSGCDRMGTMLDGILDYSRVASASLERVPVALDAVMADVRADLASAIERRRATVEVEPLPTVAGDRVQLTQLLQNLVANALKFSGADPPCVTVGGDVGEDGWTLFVRDHGIGVAPRDAERIFEMFARAAPSLEDGRGGSGIGLAVCRRIAERHGGRLWVEPTPGGGSTFRFMLPRPLLVTPPPAPAAPAAAAAGA
jgi:signal transduction histidine kinase